MQLYLDRRNVLANTSPHACTASGNERALANKTLISVSPASSPTRRSLADQTNPECERAELPQRDERDRANGRVLGRVRAHRVEYRKTTIDSPTSSKTLISVAAATPTIRSPPPDYRSLASVSGIRALLHRTAASRIAALARGRAARQVARLARMSLARRYRATPLRSLAATQLAAATRSFLVRRRLTRGGDQQQQQQEQQQQQQTTSTTTPPSAKPATRRGRRAGHKPTPAGDGSDGCDVSGDDDDDDSYSCLTPLSQPDLGYYSEMALAAADATDEPENNTPPHIEPAVTPDGGNDNGSGNGNDKDNGSGSDCNHGGAQSPSASESDSHHGGDLTHLGITRQQTGDVWWSSTPNNDYHEVIIQYDHHDEEYYDDDYGEDHPPDPADDHDNEDEYDDDYGNDYYESSDDENEEESAEYADDY